MTTIEAVNDRLFFAKRRLGELQRLNNGDIAGADPKDRQQLVQEFFFHLVGAIEFLAQAINNSLKLNIPAEKVSRREICTKLNNDDPIKSLFDTLYPQTRCKQLPADPYTDEASHFRILVLRHWVCHYGNNPFWFRIGSTPESSLFLDPRDQSLNGSKEPAIDELNHFWQLVNSKCQRIISHLKKRGDL
jgi:hypothetical protein